MKSGFCFSGQSNKCETIYCFIYLWNDTCKNESKNYVLCKDSKDIHYHCVLWNTNDHFSWWFLLLLYSILHTCDSFPLWGTLKYKTTYQILIWLFGYFCTFEDINFLKQFVTMWIMIGNLWKSIQISCIKKQEESLHVVNDHILWDFTGYNMIAFSSSTDFVIESNGMKALSKIKWNSF